MRDPLTSTADPFIGYRLDGDRNGQPISFEEMNSAATGIYRGLRTVAIFYACVLPLVCALWLALSSADDFYDAKFAADQEANAPRAYRSVVVDLREASR